MGGECHYKWLPGVAEFHAEYLDSGQDASYSDIRLSPIALGIGAGIKFQGYGHLGEIRSQLTDMHPDGTLGTGKSVLTDQSRIYPVGRVALFYRLAFSRLQPSLDNI
jgi:hypothetical protein